MSDPTSKSASTWFQDEGALLAELKRSRAKGSMTPDIPGYDLLNEIKRGGQGIVFDAVQRSTRRRVAVKVLLDSAYYSSSGRARFEREVDLAASLRHPGIVRVYDSGVTADGRAYLVMEFAEGQPLDEYVRSRELPARDVLELFARVCDAVQHAHIRGVIHRDLKPSNVRADGDGNPRVLDFGLAKFDDVAASKSESDSDPRLPRSSRPDISLTTTGQFMGSLPWASPEQARGEHDDVDTRSDVYSLGVMLYQLLTGVFPYDISGPLHTSLNNIVGTAPTPARRKRPDLDEQVEVILAKALEKDPSQRYQSAADFADDLRHHLAGEPIRARREGTWKGLQRTARRYRVAAAAAGVALVLISGAGVVAAISAKNAATQRDEARAQTAKAEATVQFLRTLLESANPDTGGAGVSTRVVDVLDSAGASLDKTYSEQPETLASLHGMLGQVYTKLDVADKAELHFERAIQVRSGLPSTAENLLGLMTDRGNLGSLRVAEGRWEDAAKVLTEVAAERERVQGDKGLDLVSTYSDMGYALRRLGKLSESQSAFEHAMKAVPPGGEESEAHLVMLNNYAQLKTNQNDYTGAESLMRQALAIRNRQNPEGAQTLMLRSNLGFFYLDLGRHAEAVKELEPLREVALRVFGPDHLSYLIILNNLGTAYHRLGENEKALPIFQEVVASYRKRPDTIEIVPPLGNLSGVLADLQRFDESVAISKEAYDISVRIRGEASQDALIPMNNYAVSLQKAGRMDESIAILRRVVSLSSPGGGVYPAGHFQHDMFRLSLGRALLRVKQYEEGEPLVVSAYNALKEKVGADYYGTVRAADILAKYYDEVGKPEEAAKYRAAPASPQVPAAPAGASPGQ